MSAAAAPVETSPASPTGSKSAAGMLDRDNPWPGLAAYEESARLYFNGRSEEIAELLRRVLDEPLTVLFGRSGLGKSSLLKAGLFPLLREQDFVPVYIRLQLHAQAPPLTTQVRALLEEELRARSIEYPEWPPDETLWQYLHRCVLEFWSPTNRLVQPVLVFDQFEEVFTLGRQLPAEIERFRTEMADLIENRVPASLYSRLETEGAKGLCLDLKAMPYKVLLSLREDFLADLENWRASIPSLRRNRMRLLPMRTANALQAIHNERTAHLVDEAQARQIVSFLAARATTETEAASATAATGPAPNAGDDSEIDPALLSLFCAGVNLRRQRARKARFDDELIGAAKRTVVADFYRECVADLPPSARVFIENELVTEQGYRNSYAVCDAIARGQLTGPQLDALVNRRLLRRAHVLGTDRIELTHDLLTGAVVHERDIRVKAEREAKQRRDQRRVRLSVIGAVLVMAVSAGIAYRFKILATEAERQRQLAEQLATEAENQHKQALSRQLAAMAGKAIGRDHELATWLAATALTYGETEQSRVAVFDTARYSWPHRRIAGVVKLGGIPKAIAMSNSGRYLAVLADAIDEDAEPRPVYVSLWDIENENSEPMRLWIHRVAMNGATRLSLSRDRDAPLVAIAGSDSIELLNHKEGACVLRMATSGSVRAMAFSGGRDERYFGWADDEVHVLPLNPTALAAPAAQKDCAAIASAADGATAGGQSLAVGNTREMSFLRDGRLQLLLVNPDGGAVPRERLEVRLYGREARGKPLRELGPSRMECPPQTAMSLGANRYSTTISPATCAFLVERDTGGDFTRDKQFDLAGSDDRPWVRDVVWAGFGTTHVKVLGNGELEVSGPESGGRVRVHLRGVDFPAHDRSDGSLKNELALSGNGRRVAAVGHRERAVTIYYLEPRPFFAELARGKFAVASDGSWVAIESERRWREKDATLAVFAQQQASATYAHVWSVRLPSYVEQMAAKQDVLAVDISPPIEASRTRAPSPDESESTSGGPPLIPADARVLDEFRARRGSLTLERPSQLTQGTAGPGNVVVRFAADSGGGALATPAAAAAAQSAAEGSSTSGASALPAAASDGRASLRADSCGIPITGNQQAKELSPDRFAIWDESSVELFDSACRDFGRYEIAGVSGVGIEGGGTILRIDLDENRRSMLVPLDRKVTAALGGQLATRDYSAHLCRIARINCAPKGP